MPPPPRLTVLRSVRRSPPRIGPSCLSRCRFLTTASTEVPATGQFQKEQKQSVKAAHKRKSNSFTAADTPWQITCGLEVHAQLNTRRKLFSDARTSVTAPPNSQISPIDAALPGVQPTLNPGVLLPALRAALAFSCTPSLRSRFDRKHYFYWDQPAGYQITQYYSPLAAHGTLTLNPDWDDVSTPLTIGIRQVQLEQDTGKTLSAPPNNLVDLNRVGAPLVEIITDPFPIESSETAGRVLSKIQSTLRAVDACVLGMEWGGLRADVNVSVAPRGSDTLGQRCEIKNLSSFKAVIDAVAAEAQRQISILEAGGEIVGETRGWDNEKGVTTRLRGKEGEVDYRYMPEPDLPAVVLSETVVKKVQETMPMLPEMLIKELTDVFGVSLKDAKTLLALDDGRTTLEGGVVGFFKGVVGGIEAGPAGKGRKLNEIGRTVGNWVLHELGGQLTTRELEWKDNPVEAERLTELIALLLEGKITGPTAKKILPRLLTSQDTPGEIVDRENLAVQPLSDEDLTAVIETVMSSPKGQDVVTQLVGLKDAGAKGDKKRKGLKSFLVGATMRELKGRVQAPTVEEMVDRILVNKGA